MTGYSFTGWMVTMIERITLKNFQAHADTIIDLDKITVIVGPNDMGKSSLLRALRWVCLNTPRGSAFVRQGESVSSVEVTVDGRTVTRTKGKSVNHYELDDEKLLANNGDAAKVPQTVAEILNVLPESFQGQHEGAFWLSLTGTEISRRLNELADLYLIDGVLFYLGTEVRGTELTKKVSKQLLEASEKEVQDLHWVTECNTEFQVLEKLQTELDRGQRRRDRLSALVGEITDIVEFLVVQESLVEGLSSVFSEVEKAIDWAKKTEGKKAKLTSLVTGIRSTQDHIDRLTVEITRIEKQIKKLTKGKCPVCGGDMPGHL